MRLAIILLGTEVLAIETGGGNPDDGDMRPSGISVEATRTDDTTGLRIGFTAPAMDENNH